MNKNCAIFGPFFGYFSLSRWQEENLVSSVNITESDSDAVTFLHILLQQAGWRTLLLLQTSNLIKSS